MYQVLNGSAVNATVGFVQYGMMDCIARYNHLMPQDLLDKYKILVNGLFLGPFNLPNNPDRPYYYTPNQLIMQATGTVLAQQLFNYKYQKNQTNAGYTNDRAYKYLIDWIYNTTHRGHEEQDSTTYSALYMDCFLTLADVSTNATLKKMVFFFYFCKMHNLFL